VVAASSPPVTYAEYLALEAKSTTKHEYIHGRVYAMSGGTPEHARLGGAVARLLGNQLDGKPCATYTSDLRVRVLATGLATYPDLTVVCGTLECDPDDPNAAVNPTVLVEILSASTEAYDREDKFAHYRLIPSLRAYVLVSQEDRRVEVFTRNDDETWTLRDVRSGVARIDAIGCGLPLDELYRNPLE
jgi:Uma2 family endonuclease